MKEGRWPRKILKWIPAARRKRGWPRYSWKDDITETMNQTGLNEDFLEFGREETMT